MSNHIEEGKEAPDVIEEIRTACGVIFQTSIDLLRIKGKSGRTGLLSRGKIIKHIVSSNTSGFPIRICSEGTDLGKTKTINFSVAGVGTLEIHRKILREGDVFTGKFQRPNSTYSHDLNPQYMEELREFAKCISTSEREIKYPQKPQSG
jgi:hypothetical protein